MKFDWLMVRDALLGLMMFYFAVICLCIIVG